MKVVAYVHQEFFKKSPALLQLAGPLYSHYAFEVLFGLLPAFDDKIFVNLLVVEYVELA